ncbi:MAG: hypothetical protein IJ659_00875 [Alloprevotella sp.]|nr:hypothetical protein [Alloprevotella sp.]
MKKTIKQIFTFLAVCVQVPLCVPVNVVWAVLKALLPLARAPFGGFYDGVMRMADILFKYRHKQILKGGTPC